jgi:hypothetical protein
MYKINQPTADRSKLQIKRIDSRIVLLQKEAIHLERRMKNNTVRLRPMYKQMFKNCYGPRNIPNNMNSRIKTSVNDVEKLWLSNE